MLPAMSIGEKIAIARKLKNMSQAQLADSVSVSAQAVGKWERGESMPDIIMFGRLAEVLGVDLNYFGNRQEITEILSNTSQPAITENELVQRFGWNMSGSRWIDADFSGLHGLAKRFSASNIERCRFVGSELSGLSLKGNDIKDSDFTKSDLSGCKILGSNLENSIFMESDFNTSEFSGCAVKNCDFSGANFSNALFKWSNVQKVQLSGAVLLGTTFQWGQLSECTIDGEITNCSFENYEFIRVEFRGAVIRNTFFKNSKLKRAKFIACKADKLSYAFMKACKADLSDVEIIK